MTDTVKTVERPDEQVAPAVAAWKIDVTAPDGRTIHTSIDRLVVDLAVDPKAAAVALGTEVASLVVSLLDA